MLFDSRVALVWVVTSGLLISPGAALADPPSPHHILVRVAVQPDEVQEIVDLGLDVWGISPDRTNVEVRVSRDELTDLRTRGYESVVIDSNVYELLEQVPAGVAGGEWTQYHNLDTTNQMLVDLQAAHPDRSALFTIGHSVEGRPINGIRISASAAVVNHVKPAFFIIGCHHAREWISVEVALYIAQQLLADYATDPDIRSLVDRGEIWIVPVLNVDGYRYTEAYDRLWRLNRRINGDGTYGVDLNRNYSHEWGHDSGSSPVPGSSTYRGPSPLSEPESQAVSDLFESRRFIGALTYHTYSQYVMSPSGYTTVAPADTAVMEDLIAEMAAVINEQHAESRYDYITGRWGVLLYLGSGVFVDWVYGVHGIMAALVEVRPRAFPYFTLWPDQILPTCVENYAGALHMMQTLFGPESEPPVDFDNNGLVDLMDVGFFVSCMSGPATAPPGFPFGCYAADLDHDGYVTLADFTLLQTAFGDR